MYKDDETTLLAAYRAFKDLAWDIHYAGDSAITGSLPVRIWNTKGARVTCRIQNGQMMVSSESMNNEMLDLLKKNKKNTQNFIAAFNNATSAGDTALEQNRQALSEPCLAQVSRPVPRRHLTRHKLRQHSNNMH